MIKEDVDKKLQKILDENGFKYGYDLDFPKYRELPDEVLLALSVLNSHGLNVVITLVPTAGKVEK